MNYKKIFVGTVCALSALSAINAYAEGNPEYVKFPTGYETSFANYTTMNRDGKEQVAKMYANDAAISSYKKGQTAAPGSVVVMEVYKPKKDADGKSIVGSDGIYEIGKLAAVAVMERRDAWEAAYSPDHRLAIGDSPYTNPMAPQNPISWLASNVIRRWKMRILSSPINSLWIT